MRLFAFLAVLTVAAAAPAQAVRFGRAYDPERYPQSSPQAALRSALALIDEAKIPYLLAHVADPEFVDGRVKANGGRVEAVVAEVAAKLDADADAVRELRRILSDGKWEESGDAATGKHPDIRGRTVYLKRVGDRWYLENRDRAK